MKKKAIILDLDNTIYPVVSIGEKLFEPLFKLIIDSGEYGGDFPAIRDEIMRVPFQHVAVNFSFSEDLTTKCLALLSDLTYEESMSPFEDYQLVKHIPCKKFLVTTGFTKLQYSKINQLNIKNDFNAIFVVDPGQSNLTKKDIFRQILLENDYTTAEVIVVGDDLNSEIKAAKELGIATVLYDYKSANNHIPGQPTINNFRELHHHI